MYKLISLSSVFDSDEHFYDFEFKKNTPDSNFLEQLRANFQLPYEFMRMFPEYRVFCLFKAQKIVGTAIVMLEKNSTSSLDMLDILEEYRGQGMGRKLFEHACFQILSLPEVFEIKVVDGTQEGIGKELYGGEKTRKQFDVQFSFPRNCYLISRKTSQ